MGIATTCVIQEPGLSSPRPRGKNLSTRGQSESACGGFPTLQCRVDDLLILLGVNATRRVNDLLHGWICDAALVSTRGPELHDATNDEGDTVRIRKGSVRHTFHGVT
jgi:hypothetical protein